MHRAKADDVEVDESGNAGDETGDTFNEGAFATRHVHKEAYKVCCAEDLAEIDQSNIIEGGRRTRGKQYDWKSARDSFS